MTRLFLLPSSKFANVVSFLEKSKDDDFSQLISDWRLREKQYENTLLTYAIALGYYRAACKLILFCPEQDRQWLLTSSDGFVSSRSTPLILSTKVAHIELILLLLNFTQVQSSINQADYSGNTALHYAAILRLNLVINKLISLGANPYRCNDFDKTAGFYYSCSVSEKDLSYPYGPWKNKGNAMLHQCDFGGDYIGTQNKNFNFIRWFIAPILLNIAPGLEREKFQHDFFYEYGVKKKQGCNDPLCCSGLQYVYFPILFKEKEANLAILLQKHLKNKKPIVDFKIYQTSISRLIKLRDEQFNEATSVFLIEENKARFQ